jgi:hypothetical protein
MGFIFTLKPEDMLIKKQKRIVRDILVTSFVNDYKANRKIIDKINHEMLTSDIPFEYTYDSFCIELLNKTLAHSLEIDIFSAKTIEEIYSIFSKFNQSTMKNMVTEKFVTLCIK